MVAARLRTPKAIESTQRVMRIIMSIVDGDVQVMPTAASAQLIGEVCLAVAKYVRG